MIKIKRPLSRFTLPLLLFVSTLLMFIQAAIKHNESGILLFIIDSIIHSVFFISLFFVFSGKNRLFFIIFVVLFAILFSLFYLISFQHNSFKYYLKNHPDLLQSCMKEEYHNPEKQTLAYCFTKTHDEHDLDSDIFYDSGNEFSRPYVERSCDWWRAFDVLAAKNSPSILHKFNFLETVRDMNISVSKFGYSYYSVSYSFEFLYVSPENKKACKQH
ncbi:ABC transporter ATP-binding protein [Dickeya lacustris]|uniref:ABC transporter ATP-binding protein n=1 Tax=Dickeya lacustris TaxID=2259638 RepID=A0ABY8G8X7_9GAMM|nr:ABC transporter ATP-binding protein [Dickeya lacustris]WFN56416.1 ABC transporter ATP-binding protein [Dickeya lacustris]